MKDKEHHLIKYVRNLQTTLDVKNETLGEQHETLVYTIFTCHAAYRYIDEDSKVERPFFKWLTKHREEYSKEKVMEEYKAYYLNNKKMKYKDKEY